MYLNVPGIKGEVSVPGYEGWIKLSDIDHSKMMASLELNVPDSFGDVGPKSFFGQISLLKSLGGESKELAQAVQSGKVFPNVEIHYIDASLPLETLSKLSLYNAMIFRFTSRKDANGLEKFCVAYTRLERKIISRSDKQLKADQQHPGLSMSPDSKSKHCVPELLCALSG